MRTHPSAEKATCESIRPPASLAQPETDVICVGHLVGYMLEAVERELILQTLSAYHGNRTHAASILGISVRSLRDRIRIYRTHGETVPEPRSFGSGRPFQLSATGLSQYRQADCRAHFDIEGESVDLSLA
jgi:DNA-binding protein Fis